MSKRVFKPRECFDFILLAGFDEREEYTTGFSAEVVAMEEPVFSVMLSSA